MLENVIDSVGLNISLHRFQNSTRSGTYLYAGEPESQKIRLNFPNFIEEKIAFNVAAQPGNDLIRLNRF